MKPLIHLLHSPHGYYLFETNRNEIVPIDEELYRILYQMMNDTEDVEALWQHPKVVHIMKMGYLSANRPKEIKHPMTAYLESFLLNKMEGMTLQLTQNCNFRCSYCLYNEHNTGKQRRHANNTMSLETAKKGIDFLHAHSRDSERISLGFYGGEPLLEFRMIEEIIDYAKMKFFGRKLHFHMTTNGSLLTDEVAEFCMKHNISVLVSIDGPKEIHDKNRVFAETGDGTFDTIMGNLNEIKAKCPDFLEKLRINMVVDPRNDFDCLNSMFVEFDVFSKDRVNSSYVDDAYFEEKLLYSDEFIAKDVYSEFVSYLNSLKRIDDDAVSPVSQKSVQRLRDEKNRMRSMEKLPEIGAPSGPCLPGITRLLVDVHGKIFPCERCSETAEVMNIGSLDEGFDIDKALMLLNIAQRHQDECKDCWAFLHCQICASQIEEDGQFSDEKRRKRCEQVKRDVHSKFLNMIMLDEVNTICGRTEGG